MKILSSENFSKLAVVVPDNLVNISGRLRIKLTAGECEMFASPDQPMPNMMQWGTSVSTPLSTYPDASPMEREEIATALETAKADILPKLSSMPYATRLFTVPSERQIYWFRNSTGEVKVILCQWGCRYHDQPKDVDVIKAIIALPRKLTQVEVMLHISYSDGLPAARQPFHLFIFQHETSITTNEQGEYYIGKMFVGKTFSVFNDEGQQHDFSVERGMDNYYAEFDIYTSYVVDVVNQYDEPLTDFSLEVDGQSVVTDTTGRFSAPKVLLTPDRHIIVRSHDGISQEYALSQSASDNHFVYHLTQELHTSITVKVINQDDKPVAGFSLNVDEHIVETNSEGLAYVSDCPYAEEKVVHISSSIGPQREYLLSREPDKNIFIYEIKEDIYTIFDIRVANENGEPQSNYALSVDGLLVHTDNVGMFQSNRVLWEEGKTVNIASEKARAQTYNLSREPCNNHFTYVIPNEPPVKIRIFDYDKTPLPGILVYVDISKDNTISGVTDSEGYASFPASAFLDGKKAKVRFTVSREYRKRQEQEKKRKDSQ